MKKLIILAIFSLSLLSTPQLAAEVNLTETLKAGKEIAQNICSGCHGVSGKAESGGNSGAVPNIYAQERDYLKIKLKNYSTHILGFYQCEIISKNLAHIQVLSIQSGVNRYVNFGYRPY
mgnify:CR=1 FL=1